MEFPDVSLNSMQLGPHQFALHTATFCRITDSAEGPGWDFDFIGECTNDDLEEPTFPYGARLYTEVAPLPLEPKEDLTGSEIFVLEPFDEESGEPFFGFKPWEEHDVSELTLGFRERDGNRYLIELSGTVAATVLGHPERLRLRAWTEQLPDQDYSRPSCVAAP